MFRRSLSYLSQPKQLSIVNAILITLCILTNAYVQVFCIPTGWAIVLLSICFLNTILFPLYKNKFTRFISGISFCVYLYCIIFLGTLNIWSLFLILFFGLGLVGYIPHLFLVQILMKNYSTSKQRIDTSFLMGIFFCLAIGAYSSYKFKEGVQNIKSFHENGYNHLEHTFFTEKILGMHFIYHTKVCIYDGWRPPKHEPLLVLNLWLNSWQDPLGNLSLEKRLDLYKKNYPHLPVKFDCSCAWQYNKNYHTDELWK